MAITTKSRLFTPAVVRKIVDNSAQIKEQTLAHLSGSNITSKRSFKFDVPGTGLKSTQQIPIDWSKFENHTFFNSAEAKVNTAFDMVINNYPFDGDTRELDRFFDSLTGFERYVFDLFPKHTGSLGFKGNIVDGTYISVNDKSGALFPSLGASTGDVVLDPGFDSLAIEFYVYLPFHEQNGDQVICQKLDCLGQTGFTLGLLDSRLKNIEVQMTGSSGELMWDDVGTPTSADDLGYDPTYDPSGGIFGPHAGMSEEQWAEGAGYDPTKEINVVGNEKTDLFFLVASGSAHLSSSMEIPKGRWAHICALYDRTPGEQNIKLFLDAKLETTSERSYAMHDLGAPLAPDHALARPPGVPVDPDFQVVGFRTSKLLIGSGSIHFKGDWLSVSEDPPEYEEPHEGEDCAGEPPDGLDIEYDEDTGLPIVENTSAEDLNGITRVAYIPTQTFSGSLDEFRIWHSVRTESVIDSFRTKNVFSSETDDLKLCFRFNEPFGDHEAGNVVLDHGGQGLHAYVSNFDFSQRDPSKLTNPSDGRYGDPNDPVASPMVLEKIDLSPALFPSYQGVIDLNVLLLEDATWYDANNPNLITKLIPKHYLLEAQIEQGFETEFGDIGDVFTHSPGQSFPGKGEMGHAQLMASLLYTWAKYFDEIKMFLDHFVNVLHVDYDAEDVVADTFLPFIASHYGFDLPRVFSDASLGQFREGENITPDQGLSDLSLQYVQNQIWRRVLTNINEMIQSKGTRHSLKALFASMGINPDKLIRFREYGGSRTRDLSDIRRNRTEIGALIDFSGTMAGVSDHRPAPGTGNPFLDSNGRNPWEGIPCEDDVDVLGDTAFITPFMMSPFLSGSRVEVGAVKPDTNIPVALTYFTIDFSLSGDETANVTTSDTLLDASVLDKKILELKDINDNITMFQIMTDDQEDLDDDAYVRIDLNGIVDRVDIADKIAETISLESELIAYNVSEENNGIVKVLQPIGGRAGNLPIYMWEYDGDSLVEWPGQYQHRDASENLLWKVPNDDDEPVQAHDTDKKLLWTNDGSTLVTADTSADGTFGIDDEDMEAAGYSMVYQFPLSGVGFNAAPQQTVWNIANTALIGVWKHLTTGDVVTHEDIGALSDNDVPATYEPVLLEQTQSTYAKEHGYVKSYYDVPYFGIDNDKKFAHGAYGIIRHDHPDLSGEEVVFIKEKGNFHGFDFTPNDGLFTSGSWTIEGTYKFDKPGLTFYPVTQSLLRIQSTVDDIDTVDNEENHVLLANLVIMRKPEWNQETGEEIIVDDGIVKLFVRPCLKDNPANLPLELVVSGVNLTNGQQWYVSFGRERADQIDSAISASYFLRVGRKSAAGEIRDFLEASSMFQETLDSDNETFWSDKSTGVNDWGPFIAIGSQSLPTTDQVDGLGLNTTIESEQSVTNFSGRLGQLRFWSKYLTKVEAKEHVRNPFSLGVEDPSRNFNFVTTPSGSFERLRLDVSFDQPVTASIEDEMVDHVMRLGYMELFDFSQAKVSGSRGALWRASGDQGEMNYHMMGYGFEAEESIIKPERFDYTVIDAKFDEHGVDNKVRIRGFEQTSNIEEFQTDVAPVYEILPSERPNDDTRFSLDISAFQGLNDDIIKIFATLDSLDNIIGAPELVFSENYPDLISIRELYFNRLTGKVKIRSFFEFFKWFDNAAGTIIEKLIPRKTHFMGVNFVIESHMLERAKLTYNYSDTYLGAKNRSALKGTILLQQFVGQVKRF